MLPNNCLRQRNNKEETAGYRAWKSEVNRISSNTSLNHIVTPNPVKAFNTTTPLPINLLYPVFQSDETIQSRPITTHSRVLIII